MLVGANNSKEIFADDNPDMDKSFIIPEMASFNESAIEFMIINTRGRSVFSISSAVEPLLTAEIVVRREGGLSSFQLSISNNTNFIGSIGSLISITVNAQWLGYGVIESMDTLDGNRIIKGSNFLNTLYDIKLHDLPRGPNTIHGIAKELTLEALSKFDVGHYEGLLNGINEDGFLCGNRLLPEFRTDDVTLGEALATLAELAGGAFYGIDNMGLLYFIAPQSSRKIRLSEDHDYHNLSLEQDKKSVRNEVKVLIAGSGSGGIRDYGDDAIAKDATSIVIYGRQYKEIKVPFYVHNRQSIKEMAEFFLVPEAIYKGSLSFTKLKYIELTNYVISQKTHNEKFIIRACKDIKDFSFNPEVIEVSDETTLYALATKAYRFTALENNAGVEVNGVSEFNLQHLRVMLYNDSPVEVYINDKLHTFPKDTKNQLLNDGRALAASPLLREIDIKSDELINSLRLVLPNGGSVVLDHVNGINNFFRDVEVSAQEVLYNVNGQNLTTNIKFGKTSDAVSLIKDLGKQAQLVNRIMTQQV
ncbi:MAG: hypothetical protein FWE37_03060 [Spirochaetaceae bacterium]|nr:hypothetical protein [Spirochaetaceae bacterium]